MSQSRYVNMKKQSLYIRMKNRNPIENFKQINKSILSSRHLKDSKIQDDKTLLKEMQTSTKALEQEAEI